MRKFLIIATVLISVFSKQAKAQWLPSGPEGGMVLKIVSYNNVLLSLTNGGLYRSIDNGATWIMLPPNLPDEVKSIVVHNNKFVASTFSGIYTSLDGLVWTMNSAAGGYYLFSSIGTSLFAVLNGKVYRSINDGVSFTVSAGAYSVSTLNATIAVLGTDLYLATDGGVWYSTSAGAGFKSRISGIGAVSDIKSTGSGLLITTSTGIYTSYGLSPTLSNTGIPATYLAKKILNVSNKYFVTVNSVTNNGSSLYPQLYSSKDGAVWVLDNANNPKAGIAYMTYINTTAFICNSLGLFASADNGVSWAPSYSGIRAQLIADMETGNNKIFAGISNRSKGVYSGGLFSSADNGTTWQKLSLPDTLAVEKIITQNNSIIAFVYEANSGNTIPALYRSTDGGITWNKLSGYTNPLFDISYANNTLFITTTGINRLIIDRSTDFGTTWQQINASGYPLTSEALEINTSIGTTIFANIRINVNAGGGIYKSTDNGITWVAVNNGLAGPFTFTTSVGNTLFAFFNGFGNGSALYRSTDMGANWNVITGPLEAYQLMDIQAASGIIYASTSYINYGVDSGYVFKSIDNGTTWTNISAGLPFAGMGKMKSTGTNLFVAPPGYSAWTNIISLPVNFISLNANKTSSGVQVNWKVSEEFNIDHYEVERSIDGRTFSPVSIVAAKGNTALQQDYSWADMNAPVATLFYRIKSVGRSGEEKYTGIVKLDMDKGDKQFVIAPNPVDGSIINLQFKNKEKGKYNIRLVNNQGQALFVKLINHNGGNSLQSLQLPASIANGSYIVEIESPGKTTVSMRIIINGH